MQQEHADVLIIGAGPAGCAAGMCAARAGLQVIVLEQTAFPRYKTCGDCITNKGVELIDSLTKSHGSILDLPHAAVRANQAIFPDGTRISRDFGSAPGYIVPRYYLDDFLRKRLEASGALLLQNTHARKIITDSHGSICGAETETKRWKARAVIAADGAGSLAWKTLQLPPRRGHRLALAVTAYYEDVDFRGQQNVCEHYFERDLPCGYFWIFPPVNGLANVGVYQSADYYQRSGVAMQDLLKRFIDRHKERFTGAHQSNKPKCWPLPHAVKPDMPYTPGLLVCGDAGCFIDPFTGEGIWQALYTGQAAGMITAQALQDSSSLNISWVRRYQRICQHDILRPAMARLLIKHTVRSAIYLRLYRLRVVRKLLQWGYGKELLEMSKKLGQ